MSLGVGHCTPLPRIIQFSPQLLLWTYDLNYGGVQMSCFWATWTWCWAQGRISPWWQLALCCFPGMEGWLMLQWGRSSVSQNGFCGYLESSEDPHPESRAERAPILRLGGDRIFIGWIWLCSCFPLCPQYLARWLVTECAPLSEQIHWLSL